MVRRWGTCSLDAGGDTKEGRSVYSGAHARLTTVFRLRMIGTAAGGPLAIHNMFEILRLEVKGNLREEAGRCKPHFRVCSLDVFPEV